MKSKPGFINQQGYECPKIRDQKYFFGLLPPKAIYRYKSDEDNPLTLLFTDGKYYRPNKNFETDMGSVPRVLQFFIPKDRFLLSFIFHDSIYKEGGIWVSDTYDGPYVFKKLSRSKGDSMLKVMTTLEPSPAGVVASSCVWFGVTVGGHFGYHPSKK